MSLQSCLTLCDPIDGSSPGSAIPGILQARTLEWVAISFSNAWKWKVKMKSLSRVWLCDPMDCSLPGSSIHGIFQARVLEWVGIAFSIIYFNWRLITLQYCSGFCHTLTWISHGCTCVPHPETPSHPSVSSQCSSPEHPVSCIKPWLMIYFTYDNIHVSMLFSQIIPPSPSPTESKSLFFTSVSRLLSCI